MMLWWYIYALVFLYEAFNFLIFLSRFYYFSLNFVDILIMIAKKMLQFCWRLVSHLTESGQDKFARVAVHKSY